jgi:hypothetical protein
VPNEKSNEIEALRRLYAPVPEKRKEPSGLKKIFTRFCGKKTVKNTLKTENEARRGYCL